MKTMIPVLAASMFLVAGCDLGNTFDNGFYGDEGNALARLNGTVIDTPFADAPANLNVYDDGYWVDVSATTAMNDGTVGMMFLMGEGDLDEVFAPGKRVLTPMSDGGTFEVLLCGETDGEYYDEPADEIEVEVEDDGAGGRNVLLRGTAQNGSRFQVMSFRLDEAGKPTQIDNL